MQRPHRVPPELDHEAGVELAVYAVEGVDLVLGYHERDPRRGRRGRRGADRKRRRRVRRD